MREAVRIVPRVVVVAVAVVLKLLVRKHQTSRELRVGVQVAAVAAAAVAVVAVAVVTVAAAVVVAAVAHLLEGSHHGTAGRIE
jgi:multisubunit Na+/H+ antiporter MnhB subunit